MPVLGGTLFFRKKQIYLERYPRDAVRGLGSADVPKMSEWQARCKWTGTAALARSTRLLSEIASILGNAEDAAKYRTISEKVSDAYCSILTDGDGKLKEEFQTAYVLPLYFKMFPESVRPQSGEKSRLADRKERLSDRNGISGHSLYPVRAER